MPGPRIAGGTARSGAGGARRAARAARAARVGNAVVEGGGARIAVVAWRARRAFVAPAGAASPEVAHPRRITKLERETFGVRFTRAWRTAKFVGRRRGEVADTDVL